MKKLNEGFVCMHCKRDVPKAEKTCRNHCPWCFVSVHVDDELPGDRASSCGGTMYCTDYTIANGTIKVKFTCVSCGATHRNKVAPDDQVGELDEKIRYYKRFFKEVIGE